jgi:CHAT domain-containing protein
VDIFQKFQIVMHYRKLPLSIALAFFFCSFLIQPALSQNWDKYFSKADEAYEQGDYQKALKYIDKLKKKAGKKIGTNNGIMANAYIKEAKIDVGLGTLVEAGQALEQSLSLNENINKDNPLEYGFIFKEAAQVMLMLGNYRQAQQYMDLAWSKFQENPAAVEQLGAEFDVMKAKILIGKGYYREALELVDGLLDASQSKSLASEQAKRDFANLLILKANSLRKIGDYLSSDSAFIYNSKWIENNLKKTDILFAENALLNTLLLKENGLSLDAQADLFEDAYLQAIRKNATSHMVTMDINNHLLQAYYANSNKARLKILKNEYKKTLNKSFPNNSIYTIEQDINDIYFEFADQDFKKLESRINRMLSNKLIPENHQLRIDLLEFVTTIGLLNSRHKNTERYQQLILGIKENLMGPETPEYHLNKIKLANYYIEYSDRFDEVAEIYATSFENIVRPQISEGHPMYLDILNHKASYFEETDQYDQAREALDKALALARKKYDNRDIDYGKELERIASLQINIGDYGKAEKNIAEALSIFDEIGTDVSDAYTAITLITEARLLAIKGEFDEAEERIFDSDKLKEKSAITLESTGLSFKDDLAGLYIKTGRLAEAQEILNESLKEKVSQFGKDSRHLNKTLVLMGELKLIKGEYSEAEAVARRANGVAIQTFGENSTKVVPSNILLARVYTTIGDYRKADNLLTRSVNIQKSQFGPNHIDVGKAISELALVKYYEDAPLNQVNDLFREAERIIGEQLGSTNPTYADILKNMAVAALASDQYSASFSYLDEAGRIWSERVSKRNNINSAEIEALKGDIYYRQKNYDQAEKFYKSAQKKFDKFFSEKHPEFIKVKSKLAKVYYMQGDWRKSQDEMEEVLLNYEDFIKQYFPALSEREKAKFWNTIKVDYEFYNTLIVANNRNEKYIGEMFNNALLTKALLLNTSIKMRQRIMNSSDEDLKLLYEDWIQKKELLTAALSMSDEQMMELGINFNQLNSAVEQLEKELSLKSDIFGKSVENKAITWEMVKSALRENEVAIEMVRFRFFDHTFTDSIMYALLYIKGDNKAQPGMILLKDGAQMENKFLNYYRNSMKFKIKDRFSYEAYWKPIEQELGAISRMYLSPDGVYNQINLESVPTGDNRFVLDNSNIVLVSNTKDIYLKQVNKPVVSDKQVAMMIGNPVFYLETEPGKPTASSGLTRDKANVISELPGTKEEIDQLYDYLSQKGWTTDKYTNIDASEEIIKSAKSPKIFHVATHGFFQSEEKEVSAFDEELKETYKYENPLLKSGLLLSGAGDILNETQYNYNIDNGILTAYEAMNLDLDQTDLVVLSACETGLGELEAGEGVYGLQRAFLVAGAKTIIMSLFKVSDDATQKLMVKFYRKWLETGNKRQAFVDAKKEIRNEYKDPIYWAPFIMIGLE